MGGVQEPTFSYGDLSHLLLLCFQDHPSQQASQPSPTLAIYNLSYSALLSTFAKTSTLTEHTGPAKYCSLCLCSQQAVSRITQAGYPDHWEPI